MRHQKIRRDSQRQSDHRRVNQPLFPKHLRPIVGLHAINEVLKVRPRSIEMAWLQQGFESNQDLAKLNKELQQLKVRTETKPAAVVEKVALSHQGAVLFSSQAPEVDWQKIYAKNKAIVLVLDGLEDVHNLGAILRTSWLLNVAAIVIPQVGAVRLTAAVHKIACGGAEHVPVVEMNQFSSLFEELKKHDFWAFGLSHLGKKTLFELKVPDKVIFCLGSEERGLRKTTERLCDELISIPQSSSDASYNASVAAGMVLLEASRQFNL
jgi:23S rRNA (guanosine2251-2'-O)-methyltransferase